MTSDDPLERFIAACQSLGLVRRGRPDDRLYADLKRDLESLNPSPDQYQRGVRAAALAAGM
jgi:hypothetical protein